MGLFLRLLHLDMAPCGTEHGLDLFAEHAAAAALSTHRIADYQHAAVRLRMRVRASQELLDKVRRFGLCVRAKTCVELDELEPVSAFPLLPLLCGEHARATVVLAGRDACEAGVGWPLGRGEQLGAQDATVVVGHDGGVEHKLHGHAEPHRVCVRMRDDQLAVAQ